MCECLKFCEGTFGLNSRLHCHFWSDNLNNDARLDVDKKFQLNLTEVSLKFQPLTKISTR